MAKPKNLEMKALITKRAFSLFLQHGYKRTSYQCIADACGVKRSIIQYYYPKKQVLVGLFINQLLTLARDYIEENGLKNKSDSVNIYLVAQVYFAFLLMNDGLKVFTYDTLSDRQLTQQMMFTNTSFALNMLGLPAVKDDDDFYSDVVMSVGGFYDVLFYHLDYNKKTDIQSYVVDLIFNFLHLIEGIQARDRGSLEREQLPMSELKCISDTLYKRFSDQLASS